MDIIKRFKIGEKNVYLLQDGEIKYAATELGLYDADTLVALKNSGYKILGYYGNILMPNGISIKEMTVSPCDLPASHIDMANSMEEVALSESEAAVYFDREVNVEYFKLKEPKVEIHTREELLQYLRNTYITRNSKVMKKDVRPLNSFVAREALFELKELASDNLIKRFMDIIQNRRKLGSYSDFKRLVAFLQKEGVLGETYTAEDVQQAYLSWGVCGIKTPITSWNTEVGTSMPMSANVSNSSSTADTVTMYTIEKCLMNRQGVIYMSKGSYNWGLGQSETVGGINPTQIDKCQELLSSASQWKHDYTVIECKIPYSTNRHNITFLDNDGVSFSAKIDTKEILIKDNYAVLLNCSFLSIKGFDGEFEVVSQCLNPTDYIIRQLTRTKVREIIRNRTADVDVKSSYELCLKEGVSPENAINWIIRRITELPALNKSYAEERKFSDAALCYRIGPSADLIAKYNPDNKEYSDISELIDIMLTTQELMRDQKMLEEDDIDAIEELLQPLARFEFVKDLIFGSGKIDHFGDGYDKDGVAGYEAITQLIMTYLKLKGVTNVEDAKHLLANLEMVTDFNVDAVFPYRELMAKGCELDRAILNGTRARECNRAVWITRVYRELGNGVPEEKRHYIFDCASINFRESTTKYIRESLIQSFEAAINQANVSNHKRRCMLEAAPAMAVALMFKQLAQKLVVTEGLYGFVTTEETIGDVKLQINIPKNVYTLLQQKNWFKMNSCCTLWEWCLYEMTPKKTWQLYCVNANITPWEVHPKTGKAFPVYNFGTNFMSNGVFSKLSIGYQNSVNASKSRVRSFSSEYAASSLFAVPIDDLKLYAPDAVDKALFLTNMETPDHYVERYRYWEREYAKEGKYITKFLLKADYLYENYYSACQTSFPKNTSIHTAPLTDARQSKEYLFDMNVVSLTSNQQNLLEYTQNSYGSFNVKDKTFMDICSWIALIDDSFNAKADIFVNGYQVICVNMKGKYEFDLRTVTKAVLDDLVAQGILYQLKTRMYLLQAVDGYYFVEVK